ncbi:Rrt6p Ecym_3357 [Eremothecium cymbalariae DBVPG|uniref:Uncharacterized protein n=1 Tax=Eremothecium cymbalariae (strain CBS 270.75 / DBVPG 7215 / KCTC 17166 / NRRL Y-17582) TaxID=931890 RepID=G8JRS6_ERECY|nr:Hypothetical protein Ecym_3357 [Eremothecium cymbalariae DBVPG\
MSLFGLLLLDLLWFLTLIRCEIQGSSFTDGTLWFEIPPYKASEIDTDRLYDYQTCIRWQLNSPATVLFLQLKREDFPVHDIDPTRFGPSSVQQGRQKLQLSIHDLISGALILKDENVPTSGRTLSFSVGSLELFDICFINISSDSSWKAIDMVAALEMSVYSVDESSAFAITSITTQDMDLLSNVAKDTYLLVNPTGSGDLLISEEARRNLNESTYSWLMYRLFTLTITMFISYCIIVPIFLRILIK